MFASNFTCSDPRLKNPFAIGGSQTWDEVPCCHLSQIQMDGENYICFDIHISSSDEELQSIINNVTFTISVPSK